MEGFSRDLLKSMIDNLTEADFTRFKLRLADRGEILWETLMSADPDKTVDLMLRAYSDKAALDVVLNILQNRHEVALALERVERFEERLGLDRQGDRGNAATADSKMERVSGQEFFRKHKRDLETRLGLLGPILADLEHYGILNMLEREEIESKPTRSKQNHALLVMLESKGRRAQDEFYKILLRKDKSLVMDLYEQRA